MEQKRIGPLRGLDDWLSLARDLQKAGTLFLLLTGGEPLLYPEFKQLYLELKKLGMILTINTNGTLINTEWADFFAANPPRRINITLYGADEDTYEQICRHRAGFAQTLQAIRLLTERGVSVKLNGTLIPENASQAAEFVRLAETLNVPIKIDTYIYPASRERSLPFAKQARLSPEEAAFHKLEIMKLQMSPQELLENVRRIQRAVCCASPPEKGCDFVRCRAGKSSVMFTWNGRMSHCVMVQGPSIPVFDIGFSRAWKQLTDWTAALQLSETCNCCRLREICTVCSACAVTETAGYSGTPEYLCRLTKEFIRLLNKEFPQNESQN